jgi:hypothetical protein
VRAVLYVLTVMLAAFYAVATKAVDIAWPYEAAYAAWNAGIGALAVSNTQAASDA